MNWLARQGFLGPESREILASTTAAFVGVSGGGGHLVQQFAHAGLGGFVPVDPDRATHTNRNRVVGLTWFDCLLRRKKVAVAKRLARGINPGARVKPIFGRWEDHVDELRACDVVLGAVDTFKVRAELEGFCRANLLPYCDLGMDVHPMAGSHFIGGQVTLSMPGDLCLRCMGIIDDDKLAREAARYGADAGPAPQVVWTNGLLASAAVNLVMQMFTPWHPSVPRSTCIEYDGNTTRLAESNRLAAFRGHACSHYPILEVGSPSFTLTRTTSPRS